MKLFFALVLTFALCSPAFAQDSKVSDMTSTTTVDGNNEYLYIVEDISSTPLSRRVKPIDLIQQVTFANLPAAGTAYRLRWVTDCESTTACSVGSGSTVLLHYDNGTDWIPIFSSTGEVDETAAYDWTGQHTFADTIGTLTSAGAFGAGVCTASGFHGIDTTNEQPYFCSDGTGGNVRSFASLGDSYNQATGDSGSASASGSSTLEISGGTGLTVTCADGSPDTCTMEIDSGGVTVAKVADPLKTKSITFRIGSDTGSALVDTQDETDMWINNIAAMTITEVKCWTDQGTSTINLQRDDGSAANILSSNVTCSTSGVTGTIDTNEDNLAVGDKIDFVMVTAAASGTPKRITVSIKAVLD